MGNDVNGEGDIEMFVDPKERGVAEWRKISSANAVLYPSRNWLFSNETPLETRVLKWHYGMKVGENLIRGGVVANNVILRRWNIECWSTADAVAAGRLLPLAKLGGLNMLNLRRARKRDCPTLPILADHETYRQLKIDRPPSWIPFEPAFKSDSEISRRCMHLLFPTSAEFHRSSVCFWPESTYSRPRLEKLKRELRFHGVPRIIHVCRNSVVPWTSNGVAPAFLDYYW